MVLFDTLPGHHLLYLDINQHECSSKHLLLCSLIIKVWNKITFLIFWWIITLIRVTITKSTFFVSHFSVKKQKQKKSTKNMKTLSVLLILLNLAMFQWHPSLLWQQQCTFLTRATRQCHHSIWHPAMVTKDSCLKAEASHLLVKFRGILAKKQACVFPPDRAYCSSQSAECI